MSRSWRPSYRCDYVISDIHGNNDSLQVILNRILPLRIFGGQRDRVFFLGNYVDIGDQGCDVIESLINVKAEYNDRTIFLRGKQDELMLRAILGGEQDFNSWMDANGRTTIAGYLKKNNSSANPYSIAQNRLKDLIPKSHIEFLQTLEHYIILDDEYVLFNSGFDVKKSIKENNPNNFVFDTSASAYVKKCVRDKVDIELIDKYVIVASANYQGKEPFIHPRYFMLGGTSPSQIIVMELNSMQMSAVSRNKSRIYKYNYDVIE